MQLPMLGTGVLQGHVAEEQKTQRIMVNFMVVMSKTQAPKLLKSKPF